MSCRIIGSPGRSSPPRSDRFHTTGFLGDATEVGRVVVGVHEGRPVYLRDVATVVDGPAEPDQYVFLGAGPSATEKRITSPRARASVVPAVTLTVAKRKGTNAIAVADRVLRKLEESRGVILPDTIHVTVTRSYYGETAEEKSNELLFHMFIAIFSVTLLIWLTLGCREAGVVAVAIPVTLALTLTVFYLHDYTLNRITLFALIFSIGILVDDAIVVGSLFYTINEHMKVGIQSVNLLDEITETSPLLDFGGTRTPRSFFRNDRRYTISARFNL